VTNHSYCSRGFPVWFTGNHFLVGQAEVYLRGVDK